MKLLNLIFLDGAPKLPGFRALGQGPYADWTVHVRPAAVFLVSPPGWQVNATTRNGNAQTVHEVPRNRVLVTWQLEQGDQLVDTGIWSPSPQDAGVDSVVRNTEGPSADHPPAEMVAAKRGPGRPRKDQSNGDGNV